MRLTALGEAPYAFASTLDRERDDEPAQWRERLTRHPWFLACADDEPAGLAAGVPSSDGLTERRHLISMWVRPSHRGLGLAALLIDAVREWAIADGARELALWVADGNEAAVRAYARAGFVATGRRQPLPSNPSVGEEQWLLALTAPGALDQPERGTSPTGKMRR
jgi:GNAT superfamily N-acetyltransferase